MGLGDLLNIIFFMQCNTMKYIAKDFLRSWAYTPNVLVIKFFFPKVIYTSYKITHFQTHTQKHKKRLEENST